MKKSTINYIVDVPLLAQSFIVSLSGLILMFGSRGVRYLGLDGREWLHLHEQLGILMVVFSFLHVILHWRWIVCTSRNLFRTNKASQSSKCEPVACAD